MEYISNKAIIPICIKENDWMQQRRNTIQSSNTGLIYLYLCCRKISSPKTSEVEGIAVYSGKRMSIYRGKKKGKRILWEI